MSFVVICDHDRVCDGLRDHIVLVVLDSKDNPKITMLANQVQFLRK